MSPPFTLHVQEEVTDQYKLDAASVGGTLWPTKRPARFSPGVRP